MSRRSRLAGDARKGCIQICYSALAITAQILLTSIKVSTERPRATFVRELQGRKDCYAFGKHGPSYRRRRFGRVRSRLAVGANGRKGLCFGNAPAARHRCACDRLIGGTGLLEFVSFGRLREQCRRSAARGNAARRFSYPALGR